MTNDSYYNVENHQIWFTAKELSHRTSSYGKDTFDAGMTVYPMPIQLKTIPRFYNKNKKQVAYTAGKGPDPSYFAKHGKEKIMINLEGNMYDFSMLYFLTSICTTTGPSGSTYTHTCALSTVRATTIPTFQMVYKMVNDEPANANDIWVLFTGCIVKRAHIKAPQNQLITCAYEIEASISVVGSTALTTQPSTTHRRLLHSDMGVITFTRGGSNVPGKITDWEIDYDDGKYLHHAQGEESPEEAMNSHRMVKLIIDWLPKYEPDALVKDDDPDGDHNVNFTVKISRNTSTDYVQFAFAKIWNMAEEDGNFDYNDYYFKQKLNFIGLSSEYETGAETTITLKDAFDNTRYEGS